MDRDPKSAASGLSIKLTPWTGADALLGGNEAHTGLAWLDLDDDRDLDFVVSAEGAVPLAILNDRLGRFRKMPLKDLNAGAADCGLLVTDFDQDGRPDLGPGCRSRLEYLEEPIPARDRGRDAGL